MRTTTKILKNAGAAPVETSKAEGQVFELTSLDVKEVSLVDKGANRREFLVTKKAGERGEVITGGKEIKINPLLKNDAELVAKDQADAGAIPGANAAATAEGIDGAAGPGVVTEVDKSKADTAAAAPVATAAPAVDEAAELAKLRAAVGGEAKKADVTITPEADGSVSVSVDTTPAAAVSPAPASVVEKIKAATLAGIDAISERLMALRADVSSGKLTSQWSQSGQQEVWSHTWYIRDMLDQLGMIGGPAWEIEAAGDEAMDVGKAQGVTKAHKAITAARLEKMRGIHKAMIYCHNDMDKLIKELDGEAGAATDGKETPDTGTKFEPDRGSSFAKGAGEAPAAAVAAAVVAPVAATPVVKAADPEVAELRRSLSEQAQMVESLRQIVAEQSATINKSRTAQDSNSEPDEIGPKIASECDNVKWPLDLADRRVPDRGKRF